MNYEEWSNQYFSQAIIIKKHIQSLKAQLKSGRASQVKELNRRISIMYPMYLDLKHTGEYLIRCERRKLNVK